MMFFRSCKYFQLEPTDTRLEMLWCYGLTKGFGCWVGGVAFFFLPFYTAHSCLKNVQLNPWPFIWSLERSRGTLQGSNMTAVRGLAFANWIWIGLFCDALLKILFMNFLVAGNGHFVLLFLFYAASTFWGKNSYFLFFETGSVVVSTIQVFRRWNIERHMLYS